METNQTIIAGAFTLMRRPGFNKLDYFDALEVLTDLLRGWVQDLDLGGRDHRTVVSPVDLDLDSEGVDYLVRMADVPDFEPIGLEFNVSAGTLTGWGIVRKVDYDVFPNYFDSNSPVCAFYGSSATPDGVKMRMNIAQADVVNRSWRLSYRLPLLSVVQMGQRPIIPTNFMRMVKLALCVALVPLVKDESDEWDRWKRETLPQYRAELLTWDNPDDYQNPGKWREYINGGVGSTVQPVVRFDDHRRRTGLGQMRGVNAPGGAYGVRES